MEDNESRNVTNLSAIRDALMPPLESVLIEQGKRKAELYGSEYGIDRVGFLEDPQEPDVTFYAHATGGPKVVELYLCSWERRADSIEVAIKITHGVDVETVAYGAEGHGIGNTWFLAGVLRAMFPVLANLRVAELVARPEGSTPKRTRYLADLYKVIGFRDLEPRSLGAESLDPVLVLQLSSEDSVRRAISLAERWLSKPDK